MLPNWVLLWKQRAATGQESGCNQCDSKEMKRFFLFLLRDSKLTNKWLFEPPYVTFESLWGSTSSRSGHLFCRVQCQERRYIFAKPPSWFLICWKSLCAFSIPEGCQASQGEVLTSGEAQGTSGEREKFLGNSRKVMGFPEGLRKSDSLKSGKMTWSILKALQGVWKRGPFECKNGRFASSFAPLRHMTFRRETCLNNGQIGLLKVSCETPFKLDRVSFFHSWPPPSDTAKIASNLCSLRIERRIWKPIAGNVAWSKKLSCACQWPTPAKP